jgi:hypothetical protein
MKIDADAALPLPPSHRHQATDAHTRRHAWLKDLESAMLDREAASPLPLAVADAKHGLGLADARDDAMPGSRGPQAAHGALAPVASDLPESATGGPDTVRGTVSQGPSALGPLALQPITLRAAAEDATFASPQAIAGPTVTGSGGRSSTPVDRLPQAPGSGACGPSSTWPTAGEGAPAAIRRVHLTPHGDGVDVWIRDASLAGSQAFAVLRDVLKAVRSTGLQVHETTLNGKHMAFTSTSTSTSLPCAGAGQAKERT